MVRSLRSQEMSTRAIATALAISERTVRRDLDKAAAANAAADEEPITTVVGLDGKRQPASRREHFWREEPEPLKPIVVVRVRAPQPVLDRATRCRSRSAQETSDGKPKSW